MNNNHRKLLSDTRTLHNRDTTIDDKEINQTTKFLELDQFCYPFVKSSLTSTSLKSAKTQDSLGIQWSTQDKSIKKYLPSHRYWLEKQQQFQQRHQQSIPMHDDLNGILMSDYQYSQNNTTANSPSNSNNLKKSQQSLMFSSTYSAKLFSSSSPLNSKNIQKKQQQLELDSLMLPEDHLSLSLSPQTTAKKILEQGTQSSNETYPITFSTSEQQKQHQLYLNIMSNTPNSTKNSSTTHNKTPVRLWITQRKSTPNIKENKINYNITQDSIIASPKANPNIINRNISITARGINTPSSPTSLRKTIGYLQVTEKKEPITPQRLFIQTFMQATCQTPKKSAVSSNKHQMLSPSSKDLQEDTQNCNDYQRTQMSEESAENIPKQQEIKHLTTLLDISSPQTQSKKSNKSLPSEILPNETSVAKVHFQISYVLSEYMKQLDLLRLTSTNRNAIPLFFSSTILSTDVLLKSLASYTTPEKKSIKDHELAADMLSKDVFLSRNPMHIMCVSVATAKVYLDLKKPLKAIPILQQSKKISDYYSAKNIKMKCLRRLAEAFIMLSKYTLAEQCVIQYLQLAWWQESSSNELIAYSLLGTINYYLGDQTKARFYHDRVMGNVLEQDDSTLKKISLVNQTHKNKHRMEKLNGLNPPVSRKIELENIERNSSDTEDDAADDDDDEIMFVPEPNQDLDLKKSCKIHIDMKNK